MQGSVNRSSARITGTGTIPSSSRSHTHMALLIGSPLQTTVFGLEAGRAGFDFGRLLP